MNKKKVVIIPILIVVLTMLVIFSNKSQKSSQSSSVLSANQASMIEVNGQPIYQDEFEKALSQKEHFFTWAKQDMSKMSSLKDDVIENLVDDALINEYAEVHKISVSDKEVSERYSSYYQTTSERVYLDKMSKMYGETKDEVLVKIHQDILREKVQATVGKPLSDWLKEQKRKATITHLNNK